MTEQRLAGEGTCAVKADVATVWTSLLDPQVLGELIPGTDRVEQDGDRYEAWLSYGTGQIRARYHAQLSVSDLVPNQSLTLAGHSKGALGWGNARSLVSLAARRNGTVITWRYEGHVGGPVALLGGFVLRAGGRLFVGRFFAAFAARLARPGV